MNSRSLTFTMAGTIGFQLIPGIATAQDRIESIADEKPLNIVFIMTDDHTAQMLSAYDNRFITTPNLDYNTIL